MPTIKIVLREAEAEALRKLAYYERRDWRAQAAVIICNELEKRGLLTPVNEIKKETQS